ncbi:hypothetical protein AAC387_Pa08g0630 [Persea americana]
MVVLCFENASDFNVSNAAKAIPIIRSSGGVGVIIAIYSTRVIPSYDWPCIVVDYDIGTQIISYAQSSRKIIYIKALPSNQEPPWHAPHVSGIVALLKVLHSDWSPVAIRSALTTTASTSGPYGEPIFTAEDPQEVANPFHYGGSIMNPDRAMDPGLIYDMSKTDYVHYLCFIGFNIYSHSIVCPSKKPSLLNPNLPSVTIPNLRGS